MMEAADDPKVKKLVTKKSAQVAYTEGFWNNYLGRRIHIDPCAIVLLFPKEKTIRKYLDTKFIPMIEATPVLRELVDLRLTRNGEQRMDYRAFPGGFLSLVASNAPDNVKSISAPVAAVEEPDDCNTNVAGQGDSITLLEERLKTFDRRKFIFGGTPTIKGLSRVDEAYENSDKRKFYVPCHECKETHVLSWENVTWLHGDVHHKIYGTGRPETAAYSCPHCGCVWNDRQKNRNVRLGKWVATAEFNETAGFYINELYSPFPASTFARLVERYLEAIHYKEQGDESKIIAFTNNALGLAYEYQSDSASEEQLESRALAYPEKQVPLGGLVLTAGVDVQGDRLAVIIRAWGREEESWLVYWGEIAAQRHVVDVNDAVWQELDSILFGKYTHESGASIPVSAVSLDTSDGNTSDAAYHYIRSRRGRGIKIMAIKGESNNSSKEIVTPARALDVNLKTKAAKYGLQVFMVGTNKAKDLISGRLKLEGRGAGRMHNYETVRADYYAQLLSEIKAPGRNGKKTWQKKSGTRNEALDCEVYALHAARVLRLHVKRSAQWDQIEADLKQPDLLNEPVEPVAEVLPEDTRPMRNKFKGRPKQKGGFVKKW